MNVEVGAAPVAGVEIEACDTIPKLPAGCGRRFARSA